MKRKNSKWFKLLAGLIILTVAFALIGAGGRDTGSSNAAASSAAAAANVNPPGVYPICKTPITINVGIVPSATVESYTDNALTKYWQDKGNFTFAFDTFAPSDAPQKLSVMINSGSQLPEVLIGFGLSDITLLQYGSQGAILSLNKYIDTLGKNFKEGIDRLTDKNLVKYITSADGNIYYLPGYLEQLGNMWSMRQFINQSWLDKLGLATPKTTDEFYNVLKAFKEKDPNGNGKADEIPMLGAAKSWRANSADALMNAFIYNPADGTDGSRLVVNNGKIDVPYNKPEWRDGLTYINKLCSEGLLDPTTFTIDDATFRQLVGSGDVSLVGFINGGTIPMSAGNPRLLEYVAFPPLTGPKGVQYTAYFPTIPATNFIITKDAKNVEAIFRWGDEMMTYDSSIWGRWGIPNVDWEPAQPGDHALYEGLGFKPSIRTIMPLNANQKSHWGYNHAYMIPMGTAEGVVLADNPLLIEHWGYSGCAVNVGLAPKDTVPMLKYTIDETDKIKDILPQLITYVNESMARFATGDLNIQSNDWDNYIKELDRIGLGTFLGIAQTAYDRMMK